MEYTVFIQTLSICIYIYDNTDYRYMHSQNARAVYKVITQISVYNGIYLSVCKYNTSR